MARRPHPHLTTRTPHRQLASRRGHSIAVVALLAVLGPGLLAGLSDDDPAGIATYSILGTKYGYELLWVLAVSTVALIVFHEVAARMGVVTGKGTMRLVRERYGARQVNFALGALVVANIGTLCAEFAGVAAGMEVLGGPGRAVTVPIAAIGVAVLVLRGSFVRVEHVLLALSAVFITYVISGVLAHPDWGAAARGLVVPSMPADKEGLLTVVATIGTTLAPWGLVFMQSYAADKRIAITQLRYERIDVITGAVLTGVIGLFVVVSCAATLHPAGTEIKSATDAAEALRPLAGDSATLLFGLGLVGAGILAAAVVPLSTAYSVAEAHEQPADLNMPLRDAPLFYGSYVACLVVAGAIVLIPGAPLIEILFMTQALNAVLLLAILPFIRALARDESLMGAQRLSPRDSLLTAAVIVLVAVSVATLMILTVS